MSVTTLSAHGLSALAVIRRATRTGAARALREAAGISQPEMGEAAGVAAATVSRWETSARVPRGEGARRYARALTALARGLDHVDDPQVRALRAELLALNVDQSTAAPKEVTRGAAV